MKILVVDDGQLAINSLIRILCRVAPDCDYISAMTTEDALSWMRQGPMDAAFLNLEMPGMNGLALTRMIQKLQPRCNIIVVTEHPEYALEALQIFVSGFLLKPANEADVRNVMEHLRYPPEDGPAGVKIQEGSIHRPLTHPCQSVFGGHGADIITVGCNTAQDADQRVDRKLSVIDDQYLHLITHPRKLTIKTIPLVQFNTSPADSQVIFAQKTETLS